MEEVDKIIIHSLRQVGCDIEETESLKQFSTEMVIEAAVRCLDVIQPGLGLPHSLPPNMSSRFRVGASIAQACTDLGYSGDIGYQTFLYSSEADVRRVFMFLIEKLPKESEKVIINPSGGAELLERQVADKVRRQLSAPWLPAYCRRRGLRWLADGSWSREGCGRCLPFAPSALLRLPDLADKSKGNQEYTARHLAPVVEQVESPEQLLPAVISTNAHLVQLQQSDTPTLKMWPKQLVDILIQDTAASDFTTDLRVPPKPAPRRKVESKEDVEEKRRTAELTFQQQQQNVTEARKTQQQMLEEVRQESEELRKTVEEIQLGIKQLNVKVSKIKEERSTEERILREQEEKAAIEQRTYELLPEADENLAKLQRLVESDAQRLVGLAAQWEKHRSALLAKYRDLRQMNSSRASESQKQADAVRSLREKVRDLTEEVRSKEELHTQLLSDYEKISKDTNLVARSAYTRRIMEIIGNIRKQREEIAKVLADTRELQKEINTLSGQLERSFTVADELIFRDAKKDEVSRRAYKLLATLHSDCSELVHMVEETGATVREIRDLEEQIETETAKNVGANLERVSADLKQMKQENAALTAQLNSRDQGSET